MSTEQPEPGVGFDAHGEVEGYEIKATGHVDEGGKNLSVEISLGTVTATITCPEMTGEAAENLEILATSIPAALEQIFGAILAQTGDEG